MNKKMRSAYERYRKSDKISLWQAYRSFSDRKLQAWDYCEDLCKRKNGKALKVIGANANFFSAGFVFKENGEDKFMYITHGGDYEAVIEA